MDIAPRDLHMNPKKSGSQTVRRREVASEFASKRASAFTLRELLVVVGTISVLGVVALSARPAPGHAASLAQCLNNVRQICQAARMYETDYQDYVVYPNWSLDNPGWLYTPNPTSGGPPAYPGSNPLAVYQGGKLWPYVRDTRIYVCPTDSTNSSSWAVRANRLSTYVMNGAVVGFQTVPSPGTPTYRAGDFKFPAAVLFWEPADTPICYNDGASWPNASEGPSTRHITGCVIGCLDGHSQFLRYSDALPLMAAGTANELWCNPGSANGH
jgi:type II secretory pathway pseudopilin PulG